MPIQISGVQMGVITGGPSSLALEDLSDVSIVAPATGQYLRYNSGISEWQNAYLGSDIYDFLDTNMFGSNGVAITYTPGPNTIDVALSLTASGDATGSVSSGNLPLTLATVNGNVGTFGSGSAIPVVTVNAKGLITAVSTVAFSGTSPLATSLAGGTTGALPYQSAASTTAFLTAGTASQVLIGGASAPSWSSSPSGLTSVSATTFIGALSGNATTATTAGSLATPRSITATGDASWTVNFDGSSNVSAALTLATVNSNVGTFASVTVNGKGLVTAATALSGDATTSGSTITLATVNGSPQSDQFRKVTVTGKGLVTATTAVSASDITTALGFTPVNKAGDTMSGYLILNADPVSALGAVTKQYADNIAAGVNVHPACVTATTAALPASTYNNGASGVGATLTANVNGAIGTVGGYGSLAVNDRVLVKDQASQLQNGIYVVTQLGSGGTPWILTRASDFDGAPSSEIEAGDLTYVQSGTLNGTQWVQTTTGSITVGTTAIVFSQFSGAGTYIAGSGIDISSNVISNTGVLSNIAGTGIGVSGATGNVTISNTGVTALAGTASQVSVSASTGSITVSLPSSVTIGGTMTAGTFSGAGTSLTGTAASLSIGGSAPAGSLTGATLAAGVTASSLTSVGTLVSLNATGSIQTNGGVYARSATANDGYINIVPGTASNSGYVQFLAAASGNTRQGYIGFSTTNNSIDTGTIPYVAGTHAFTGAITATGNITTSGGAFSGAGTSLTGTAASLSIGGNAGTATVLQTARTINGTSFNGSANITVTASTTAALTMNNGGAGVASGTTFDGGTARTLSYNTLGAPSTTGTGASGTWAISITGNSVTVGGFTPTATAGTASRVVVADGSGYINNTYFNGTDEGTAGTAGTVTSILTKRGDNYYRATSAQSVMNYLLGTSNTWTGTNNYLSSSAVGVATQSGTLVAYGNSAGTNAATMSFHRPGVYAINMGLDTDNVFRVGGWSDGASVYRMQVDASGNLYSRATMFPTNGANGLRSNSGTYGSLEVTGIQNSYSGIYFSGGGASTTGMFDGSGNGGDYDTTTGWHYYWNRSNACLGIGGSTTLGGYRSYVNGNEYVAGSVEVTGGINVATNITNSNFTVTTAGTITKITGNSPPNGAIRCTPNLHLNGGAGNAVICSWDNGNGGSTANLAFRVGSGASVDVFTVTYAGTTIATGDITAFSDIRVKKNINVIPDALNKVSKIRGVTFQRTDNVDDVKYHTGVIAQEVEEVLPEVVHENAEGMKTVAYGNMVGLLIEAVKELNAKVEMLKAEIRTLRE